MPRAENLTALILAGIVATMLGADDSTVTPQPRQSSGWTERHWTINRAISQTPDTELIFIGDSITQGWESAGSRVWKDSFDSFKPINLGISGDRTEHVLWRLENGNVDDIAPRAAVVMIGTNNFGGSGDDAEEVFRGVVAVVESLQEKLPNTHVLLLDIFPRGEAFNAMRGDILQVNQALQSRYAGNEGVKFLSIGHTFLEDDGTIDPSIMPDALHLSEEGYRRWARAIAPAIGGGRGRPTRSERRVEDVPRDTSRPGPWDFDLVVYRGKGNRLQRVTTFERAGVPTITRMKDGRLIAAHQWFPENDDANFDTGAVRFSEDDGRTWGEPQPMQFDGLDPEARFPFDPTLVSLPDGRLRLYFTYMVGGRRFDEVTPSIACAVSSDGVHYTFEDICFAIDGTPTIDCAAGLLNGTWHLIVPIMGPGDPRAYHATSADGVHFTREDDLQLGRNFRWLGCVVNSGERLVFYGSRQHGGPSPGGGLPSAVSSDGFRWRNGEALSIGGADPGVVVLDDGTRVMVVTGGARPGTASALQQEERGRKTRKPPPRR